MYQGNCYGCSPRINVQRQFYSHLESTVARYAPINNHRPLYSSSILEQNIIEHMPILYQATQSYLTNQSYQPIVKPSKIHNPQIFLKPTRPKTPFIENLSPGLKKNISIIFKLTTKTELPKDILISILNSNKFKNEHRKHSRFWDNNIQGFAINRKILNDFSSVFIKQNALDKLILTIGHEIGHCLSIPKANLVMEEAKAFAFEIAWMRTIHKFNIMNLRESMNLDSLNPGSKLHNQALQFAINNLKSHH